MLLTALLHLTSTVAAIGENCGAPSTLWDKHTCEVIEQTDKYQRLCIPRRLFPDGATNHTSLKQLKGVVLLFHGYTACPDAYDYITKELQDQGFMTLVPLLPGNGINLGYQCDRFKACVFKNINPTFLPTKKEGYIEWVEWALDMVREEVSLIPETAKADGFFVGSLGLSAGGPLGLYALSRPKTPITKLIVVNPFMGVTLPSLDFKINQCKTAHDQDKCEDIAVSSNDITAESFFGVAQFGLAKRSTSAGFVALLSKLIGDKALSRKYHTLYPRFMAILNGLGDRWLSKFFRFEFGWGSTCFEAKDRAGFCGFRFRNILALHSFGSFALSQIDYIKHDATVSIMQTGRDGAVSDAITHTILTNLQARGVKVSKCRFAIGCPLDKFPFRDNTCGPPHSAFSRPENQRIAPYNLYWEKSLFQNIINIFNGVTTRVGIVANPKDFKVCVATNTTLGLGETFDIIGAKYYKNAKIRYGKIKN